MSIEAEKFGLSCNDTKRYIIPCGAETNVGTLAFGHKRIKEYEAEKLIKPPETEPFTPKKKRRKVN